LSRIKPTLRRTQHRRAVRCFGGGVDTLRVSSLIAGHAVKQSPEPGAVDFVLITALEGERATANNKPARASSLIFAGPPSRHQNIL